ncbi:hypothetical protein GX586_08030 [bacterium]|nr:hypothetical protein [bacterium]
MQTMATQATQMEERIAAGRINDDQRAPADPPVLAVCAWCGKVRFADGACRVSTCVSMHTGPMTHGICPVCVERMRQ